MGNPQIYHRGLQGAPFHGSWSLKNAPLIVLKAFFLLSFPCLLNGVVLGFKKMCMQCESPAPLWWLFVWITKKWKCSELSGIFQLCWECPRIFADRREWNLFEWHACAALQTKEYDENKHKNKVAKVHSIVFLFVVMHICIVIFHKVGQNWMINY